MKHETQPPRLLLALFRWFCHPDFREEIEGDLLEKFHADLQRHGLKTARRQFAAEVFSAARLHLIIPLNRNTMTTQSWKSLLLIALLIAVASIAPFLPTPSVHAAHGISVFVQTILGYLGLAFVPFGLLWLIIELRNKRDNPLNRWGNGYYPALLALTPLLLVWLFIVATAFRGNDWRTGMLVLAFLSATLAFCAYRVQRLKKKTAYQFNHVPVFLIAIPLLALISSQFIVEKVAAHSREKTIRQAQPLISAIEKYKTETGEYPRQLEDLKSDWIPAITKPGSNGVSAFFYEKTQDAFQLQFEKLWHWNATEVLVYNHLGKGSGKDKYKSFETSHANWRYHLAD